jgi:hypothetical protein
MKKKIIMFTFFSILILVVIDRYLWMPDRVKKDWRWESGELLGDPLIYEEDFEVHGTIIIMKKYIEIDGFKNTNRMESKEYYIVGCYFGTLYVYNGTKKRMTVYSNE